jgi:hypothetical protein
MLFRRSSSRRKSASRFDESKTREEEAMNSLKTEFAKLKISELPVNKNVI